MDALYVIADIHGNYNMLSNILNRILPLRKSDGGKDKLIFLGDYIDRHIDSHKVIDKLIEIKKEFPEQIKFIRGNHELMLLKSINKYPGGRNFSLESINSTYKMWMNNGGRETIKGYLLRAGKKIEGFEDLPRFKIDSLIPKEHIDFFESLENFYEYENFVFVHGGLNPLEPVDKQDMEVLAWDGSLCAFVENAISVARGKKQKVNLPWQKIVICGHMARPNKMPIIADNYLMLDVGSPARLLITELRTRQAFLAQDKKDRLIKFKIENSK